MIVWLASYPRSGNTFFRIVLHLVYGLDTYSIYDDPLFEEHGATGLVGQKRLPGSLEDLDTRAETYFVKTHDHPQDERPAIYILRDGRDSALSYAGYLCAFGGGGELRQGLCSRLRGEKGRRRDALQQVILGHVPFGRWSEHVETWTARQRRLGMPIVRFEDLIEVPQTVVPRCVEDLRIDLMPRSGVALPSFTALNQAWPEFFRRGERGQWQTEMPPDMLRLFHAHQGRGLALLEVWDADRRGNRAEQQEGSG